MIVGANLRVRPLPADVTNADEGRHVGLPLHGFYSLGLFTDNSLADAFVN